MGSLLTRQFDVAWKLCTYHLSGLTTEECLWRPAAAGLHVQRRSDGMWIAEWPEHEGYDLGPPSIAWLTWHVGFWWSMVLDHCAGEGKLSRETILWPGEAERTCAWIFELEQRWRKVLDDVTDDDLRSSARTRWPFQSRPFGDVVAWVNTELTKNAAEIGYARFLYAVRAGGVARPRPSVTPSIPSAEAYASEPVRFPPLVVVDLASEAAAVTDPYRNQVLSQVNSSCLRLGVLTGDYPWHQHPRSDELFLVMDGRLEIALADGRTLRLRPWQCVVVPAGTVHRTRGVGRTINLCFEALAAETVFVEPAT